MGFFGRLFGRGRDRAGGGTIAAQTRSDPPKAARRSGGMSEISMGAVERAVKTTAATVLRNEKHFCDLDALAGDGDFGASLAAGWRVIEQDLPTLDKSSIGNFLLKISMIVTKHVGGSSGPVWGTAFMRAALLTKEKTAISLADLEKMITSAIEGIQQRGGAQPGDKTVIDAMIPVRDKVAEHAKGDNDPKAALRDATVAAEEAVERAKAWVAKRGRQQFTGDRSIGTPDPGMVAIATILGDLCTEFGVSRSKVGA
jgi:phosphoenolpyruvate---glycerone phosphotransferase subunit DhaL